MSDSRPSLDSVVVSRVAERMKLDPGIVGNALRLLEERAPIPYLARYRRDAVGGLDERALREIRAEAEFVRTLEQRREFVLRAVSEREGVPEKLKRRIERCRSRLEIEYLYEPYRPARKTPGSVAKEQGLEPLADAILAGGTFDAASYVSADKGVADGDQALLGAREILAERIAVDPEVRGTMLRVVEKEGVVGAAPAHGKSAIPDRFGAFRTYEERLARAPSHRFLALCRAEHDGVLSIRVSFPEEKIHAAIAQRFFPAECSEEAKAVLDQVAAETVRLLRPAVVRDALDEARQRADADVIGIATQNLHDLLLFPPAGPRRTMGVDPAPRGTIPFACVDERGQHLEHARLKLFGKDEEKIAHAREEILRLVRTHGIEIVALGNGQGRHPCEAFLRRILEELGDEAPPVIVVNEVGAGTYASGPVGRTDLPALSVPIRGAVSMARRLMDPLAELVKTDLRQIGGGHHGPEIDGARLGRALDEVVEHCVNLVGVDLNTASVQLLAHVCGLSTSIARQIVEHRERSGRFATRAALKELPFVSDRAFEYAGGFLRVRGGDDPLDATGVHPSHRPLVDRIAASLGAEPAALIGNGDATASVSVDAFADDVFTPATVAGVLAELMIGDHDPRPPLEVLHRPAGVRTAADLRSGMRLSGRVTNVTNFGAFVDVGVQQDGLVHVSELADHFVKDPTTVVHVGQMVHVRVLGVDADSQRISLSMKSGSGEGRPRREKGERGGGRRPRRDRPQRGRRDDRRPRRDHDDSRVDEEDVVSYVAESADAPAAPPDVPENPVPSDMSEEEFMKRKLEELRRRFG